MEAKETEKASDPQNYQNDQKYLKQLIYDFPILTKKKTWQLHSHCRLVTDHVFTVKQQKQTNKQLCYSTPY